jgi:hypothetical protein
MTQLAGKQIKSGSIAGSKLDTTYEGGLLYKDGSRALTGNLDAGGNRVTNLAAPVNPNDAARLADLVAGSYATSLNKDMTASVTAADFALACATAVAATPASDGYVRVSVNGLGAALGDGVKTKDCYFSADGGTTARAIAAIASGDLLYWVGSVAGYELDATDRIDFEYAV